MDPQKEGTGRPDDQETESPPEPCIMTTPPFTRFGMQEEIVSQSDSPGSCTRVSSSSGVSLGEAIRHSASEGLESWYQLPAEEDASCFTAASMTRMGGAGMETALSEFPTLEEGTLMQSVDPGSTTAGGLISSGLLEMQDSHNSPNLLLLPSISNQAQNISDNTMLQRTELEFAPLRWTLDNSGFSELQSRPLQMSDAIQLASTEVSTDLSSGCFTLSQHPLAFSTFAAGDASSTFFLSQHPIPPTPKSIRKVVEGHCTETDHRNDGDNTAKVTDSQVLIAIPGQDDKHVPQPAVEGYIDSITRDGSFLDSSVSAPMLLELLEKEVGLSSSGGSGSENSSHKMLPETELEQNEMEQVEPLDGVEHETESLGPEVPEVVINESALELLEMEVGLWSSGRSSPASSSCVLFSSMMPENEQNQQVENLDFVDKGATSSGPGFYLDLNKEHAHDLFKKDDELYGSSHSSLDSSSYKMLLAMVPEKRQVHQVMCLDLEERESPSKPSSALEPPENLMQKNPNLEFAEELSYKLFSAIDMQENQIQQDGNLDQETAYKTPSTVNPDRNQMKQDGNVQLVETNMFLAIDGQQQQMQDHGTMNIAAEEAPYTMASAVGSSGRQNQKDENKKLLEQDSKFFGTNILQYVTEENMNPECDPSTATLDRPTNRSFKLSSERLTGSRASDNLMATNQGNVDMSGSGRSDISGITVRPVNRMQSGELQDVFRTKLCSDIQIGHQETNASVSEILQQCENESSPAIIKPQSDKTGSPNENTGSDVHPRVGNAELTVSSGGSIERGHQEADLSPFDRPPQNYSPFLGGMSQPISQSTPGFVPSKSVKKEIADKMMHFMSNLHSSRVVLSKERFDSSKSVNVKSSGRQCSDKTESEADSESNLSPSASSPPSGRINSLPSLSYMEKVGAWNVNQPLEKMSFDALVLRGLNGVSPKKKAYSAVADSLNRMLAQRSSSSSPKRSLAASFSGTTSLTSLISGERKSLHDLTITRSHSFSEISTVSKETIQTEGFQEKKQNAVDQPLVVDASEKSHKSQYKNTDKSSFGDPTEQIRTSSVQTVGDSSPTNIDSPSPDTKVALATQNVDPLLQGKEDLKNRENSSQSNSHIDRTIEGSAGAVSGQSLTSLEVDNYAPYWSSVAKTPERKELNIEERIPTYLRNLGIEQSPSAILNPFVPRGPIREPEFSPSDLRTMKDFSDSTVKSRQLSEGGSLNAADFSQSSRHSGVSTMSMSIPMGSECGQDTPPPTEFTLRNSSDRPISQYSRTSVPDEMHPEKSPTQSREVSSQLPLRSAKETPSTKNSVHSLQTENQPDLQTLHSVFDSGVKAPDILIQGPIQTRPSPMDDESPKVVRKHVQSIVDTFESGTATQNIDSLSSSPLMEDSLDMDKNGESLPSRFSTSLNQHTNDLGNDSFVGSKTLKEIRQLLAEADNMYLEDSNLASSLTSPGGTHEDSPLLWRDLNSSQDSEALRRSICSRSPLLQRRLSWDASLTDSLADDHSIVKSISMPHGLEKRENIDSPHQHSLRRTNLQESHSRKIGFETQNNLHKLRSMKVTRRDGPEGCSNVAIRNKVPVAVFSASPDTSEHSSIEKVLVAPSVRTTELLSSVSDALHGLEEALAMTEVGKVGDRPALRDSDDSSSVDSLAARVTSLLKGNADANRATQMIQKSKEDQKRACALVKLKLADQSTDTGEDLNAEDRRRIEEIKLELLESAKKAGSAKSLRITCLDPDSLSQHGGRYGTSCLRDPRGAQSSDDIHTLGFKEAVTHDISVGQFRHMQGIIHDVPSLAVDKSEQRASNFKPSMIMNLQETLQSKKHAVTSFEAMGSEMLMPPSKVMTPGLKESSDGQMDTRHFPDQQLSEESTRPITSITFSSRKCTPSPSISPILNTNLNDKPTRILPLEVSPIGIEEKRTDNRQSRLPKESLSARSKHHDEHCKSAPNDFLPPHSSMIGIHEHPPSRGPLMGQRGRSSPDDESHSSEPQIDILRDRKPSHLSRESTDLIVARESSNVPRLRFSARKPDMANERAVNVSSRSSFMKLPEPEKLSVSSRGSDTGTKADIVQSMVDLVPKDSSEQTKEDKVQSICLSQTSNAKDYRRVQSPPPSDQSNTKSATLSSPTRKAMSCVRVTIAPKAPPITFIELSSVEKSDMPIISQDTAGGKHLDRLTTDVQRKSPPLSQEAKVAAGQQVERSLRSVAEPMPQPSQDSYFLHSPAPGGDATSRSGSQGVLKSMQQHANVLDSAVQGNHHPISALQTKKGLSDAMTQITTESPEKTTFSAEIYIQDEGVRASPRSADLKTKAITTFSSRQADQPLLMPYRPLGSSEMYYVPYREDLSRDSPVRSDTTIESTHSGSNDAVSPEFPAEVLGSEDECEPTTVPIKHKEGIYSRRASPKVAWQGDDVPAQKTALVPEECRESPKSVESVPNYVRHPEPEYHVETGSRIPYTSTRHPASPYMDRLHFEKHHIQSPCSQEVNENEFLALDAEVDYSRDEDRDGNLALRFESLDHDWQHSTREKSRDYTLKRQFIQTIDKWQKQSLNQSNNSSRSLDDLWARFIERQKKNRMQDVSNGSQGEISLVERLDRLARLLQNPAAYSLMYAKDEPARVSSKSNKRSEERKKRQKVDQHALETFRNSLDVQSHLNKVYRIDSMPTKSTSRCPEANWTDLSTDRIKGILQKRQNVLEPSDSSSSREDQNSDLTVRTESQIATETESDTVTQAESGSTISTIDTVRLIRAFGPERVCPSSKLSRLYSTIDHQKHRSDVGRRGSRKALVKEPDKIPYTELQKSKPVTQMSDASESSDTVSSVSSSWGPSPALAIKKHVRHKGVQAGDLEIVMGGTKKNTRDVGMTFPSPNPHREIPTRDFACTNGILSPLKDGIVSDPEGNGDQKKWPNGILTDRLSRRSRVQGAGVTWFVPVEDLKSGSKKENQPTVKTGHSPSWYEPLSSTKPWREPLREKNIQEQLSISRTNTGMSTGTRLKDAENRSPSPFMRITLQEALKIHRPSFISSSRERMKRLELIREERKLQSLFQMERDQLFNPLEDRRDWQGTKQPCTERDELIIQKRPSISKKEMVERSKRIYEQLPEIRKRKEDEKRQSEYTSYRLKAQLFKKKVTNHVLGRKTPWN
ncbi:centrosome-associated protein ALMS1 isoform X2 [Ambystoma mexicanum]|uniref:centrosome-associated protein ALMS1 isoform X2 n=1 Tax=Ambystoma mexicanum TaxID=8296 RepID=UPI0037E7228D